MYQIIRTSIRVGAGIIFFGLILLFFMSWGLSYDGFIQFVEQALNKKGWSDFLSSAFPRSRFLAFRWILAFICIALLCGTFYLVLRPDSAALATHRFLRKSISLSKSIWLDFQNQHRTFRIILVLFLTLTVIRSFWHIVTLPLEYDEMWTANYFINGPFWKSFLLPGNNHIFYTLAADFFTVLPVGNAIAIRLPAFFAGLCTLILFWKFLYRSTGPAAAATGVIFLGSSVMFSMYSVLARSYIFLLLFSLLMIWSVLRMRELKAEKYFRQVYFIVVLLGYWSNPLFIYGHVCLLVVIFLFGLRGGKPGLFLDAVKLSLMAGVAVLILYMPTIIAGHARAIVQAAVSSSGPESLEYALESNRFIAWCQLGFKEARWLYFPLLLSSVIVSGKKPVQFFVTSGGLISFILILLFSWIQQRRLSDHLVIFLTLYTGVSIAVLIAGFRNLRNFFYILIAIAIFIANSFFAHSTVFLYWSRDADISAKEISLYLLQHNISGCYLQSAYIKPALEYYSYLQSKPMQISMAFPQSQDYVPFNPSAIYPSVVVDVGQSLPGLSEKYRKIYSSSQSEIWVPLN